MKKNVFIIVLMFSFIIFFQEICWAKATKNVWVGNASSVQTDVKEAVKEAAQQIKAQLGKHKPEYVILFSTVGYDSAQLLSEVKNALGKNIKIYGGTSCLAVFDQKGFFQGKTASLSMLAIASKKMKFGVGGADLNNNDPFEAGKTAILKAMENAGEKGKNPDLILITPAPGVEEGIIEGIESVVGQVPITGGSSADSTIEGKWMQYANNEVFNNGVVLTAIYTKLKIGLCFEGGYNRTVDEGVVTKSKDRVIYEIDNKPAAVVYNEWVNGEFNDVINSGGNILSRATFYPLAKIIRGSGDVWYTLTTHPSSINFPEQSLSTFSKMEKGDKITLMRGDWEILLNRGLSTPKTALKNGGLNRDEIAFGIFTFCGGAMLAIPEGEREKLPLLVNSVLRGVPYIGTFTFGEQGYVYGIGNMHGNLVSTMVLFSHKEK
ncbi:MAG: FIST C-terminal domain-containing protein [Candidatus Omnitrophica bacterium]|nr:FIST C-terminal domain-containing protein [Candidatus Omnitrophota bacterium]